MNIHIDYSARSNCYNVGESYGEICVQCNCCGRFDKKTMYECRLETDKRHLEEELQSVGSPEYPLELQQKNIQTNILWFKDRIAAAEKEMSNHV